jgi:hypothetical protein
MSRRADAYHDRVPDHSPEPSARKAYYAGVATMEQIVRLAMNHAHASAEMRGLALDAILAMVRSECEREGMR